MISKFRTYLEIRRKMRFMGLPRKEIEQIQLHKMKILVEHAYSTVPFYHELFGNHRFNPKDLKTLDDIKKIPIISKNDLLTLDETQITSSVFKKTDLCEAKSSGTTGEPFSFYMDKKYLASVGLESLRAQMLHGYRLTDKVLTISGEHEDLGWFKSPLQLLFLRDASFSSFSSPSRIVDFYIRFKPDIIKGFITSIYAFALWLEEKNIILEHKPKFIICSAETVHDFMREKISEVFQTKVIDRYATIELGVVAVECKFGGYHIFEDSVLPEIVEINDMKYFVGTNLNSFATPFIRYNTFDICEPWSEDEEICPCGMNTRKLKGILGRDNDFIKTPEGKLIAPIDLIFFMRSYYPFVKKFRFVQDDINSLRLEVVLRKEDNARALCELHDRLKDIAKGLFFDINIVEDIPKDASGKMRIVYSTV